MTNPASTHGPADAGGETVIFRTLRPQPLSAVSVLSADLLALTRELQTGGANG